MRMLVLAVVVGVGVSGCAHTYSKPGASQSEFDLANTDCQVKCNQAGVRGVLPTQNFMDRCMSGQGWVVAK